jgi:hypothetical protein
MLDARSADSARVIRRVLVLTALACSFLISASFVMFARDQIAGASAHQQRLLAAGQPEDPGVEPSSPHRGQPRRFIDGASHRLTAPFDSLVQSDSQWVLHIVPALVGLLVYGVGLGYLARWTQGMPRSPHIHEDPLGV